MNPIVIVGAGMAAYSLARELRRRDTTTPLMIVTRDRGDAYPKPMLSNAFALGKDAATLSSASAQRMGEQLAARVLSQTTVHAIDPAARTLATSAGPLHYASLVLALGAQPIRLALGGAAAAEVLSVNHLDDYAVLRQRLAQHRPARVAILGAGLIGCEFADDLAGAGHAVTLIDPNARLLAALAAPGLSDALAQAWRARPITLRLGTSASAIEYGDGALHLQLADGSSVAADVVVSAVGLRPDIALAQAAGLATGRGIMVDAYGQTSAPAIYALGDCAQYPQGVMPYVAPLLAAARAIAATLAGQPTPIALGPEPVIVKTASMRLALLPPAPGSAGRWVEQLEGQHAIARFIDEQGALRGFGLGPFSPALRQKLLGELAG